MAGGFRFWLVAFAVGVFFAFSVWWAGNVYAATPPARVSAPLVGRASADLRYGEHARGLVSVVARVRGGRLVAVFSVSRLSLPALGAGRRGALLVSASTLCGGRFGAARSLRSASFAAPARGLSLPAVRVSLPVGVCARGSALGVFFRVSVAALRPLGVLHSVSGSVPSLRRGGGA